VGLASSEYEELATVLGAQLKNSGLPMKEVAKQTKGLISTGADLSAQFGGSAKEAVEALSSALRGETDPIEKYGVAVKQADIAARMAADGTDKLEGKAAKQAKTAALLALVTEQTADAHGAFAREADTAAGQSQRTAAQMENMQASLGAVLLPVLTVVTAALGDLFGFMEKHTTTTQIIIGLIAALAAVIVVMNVALTITAALGVTLSAAFLIWVVAIVAVIAIFVLLYNKVGWFRAGVDAAFAGIKTVIGAVARFLVTVWEGAVNAVKAVIKFVPNAWDSAVSAIRSAVSAVTGWIETAWSNTVAAVKSVIKKVSDAWDTAVGAIRGFITDITDFLETRWDNAVRNVGAIIDGLTAIVSNVLSGIRSKIDEVWAVFRSLGTKIQGLIGNASSWLFNVGADIIRGLINGIKSMAGAIAGEVQALADKIPGWVKKRLGISSPSKVMAAIGKDVMGGLSKGMEDGLAGIKAISEAVAETVSATMEKKFKSDKKARTASQAVIKAASDETEALEKNARKRQKVYKDLADAREALTAIQDERKAYAEGITNAAAAFGAITNLADKEDTTATGILADMRKRVEATQHFQALMEQLAGAGLSQGALRDIAAAGVEGGTAIAQGLADGGTAAITEANALQTALEASAAALGTNTATALYAAGEQGAQAIVDGLEIKQENLDEWAETLAKNLAKALKKAIKKAIKGATGGGGGGGGGDDGGSLLAFPTGATAAPAVANPRAMASGRAVSTGPTIIVNGAIDPEATARQIRRILAGHDRRMGLAG
jgi:phage-related protein